jgi:hypothetical protein
MLRQLFAHALVVATTEHECEQPLHAVPARRAS